MTAVKKLTLGLRPDTKMFRIDSLSGLLIDALLEARGKEISNTYYNKVGEIGAKSIISLINEEIGNSLFIDKQNITFIKSAYPNGHIDLDETFAEFKIIWNIIQSLLKIKGIRTIGFVAEHRFDPTKNNNTEMISKLTHLTVPDFPANFSLHYESRTPVKLVSSIDEAKDSFINTIYDFYDSALDSSVPIKGKINVNLDYQKYYSPLLDKKIVGEMETHFYAFKKELKAFDSEIEKLRLNQ